MIHLSPYVKDPQKCFTSILSVMEDYHSESSSDERQELRDTLEHLLECFVYAVHNGCFVPHIPAKYAPQAP
jgi:hypothetical protein